MLRASQKSDIHPPSRLPRRSAGIFALRRPGRMVLAVGLLAATLTLLGSGSASAVGENLAVTLAQVDGTPDWSADDAAGHDSGPINGIVRTNDNLTYQVEISVNGGSSANTTFTIPLAQGTELSQVPAYCTGSGSSLTPATLPAPTVPVTMTSWLSLPSQTLVCNVGTRTANSTLTYPVVVKVRPEVPNGTQLTPVSASVVTTSVTTPAVTNTVNAKVSARAQFDLSKNAMSDVENQGFLNGAYGIRECPDPLGAPGATRRCFRYSSSILISAPSGGKGLAPMADATSFSDDLSPASFYGPSVLADADWAAAGAVALAKYGAVFIACEPESFSVPGRKIGTPRMVVPGTNTATNSVRDSGTTNCAQPGGPGTAATIDVSGIDSTAYTYPTEANPPSTSVPADKAYVYSMTITYDIPVDAVVDLGTPNAGGTAWSLPWDNKYTGFAPDGVDGTVNDPAANPTFNDHRASTSVIQTVGGFDKWFSGVPGAIGNTSRLDFKPGYSAWEGPASSTGDQNGDGQIFPGAQTLSTLYMNNSSTSGEAMSFLACDAWDNTKSQLMADSYPGGVAQQDYMQFLPSNGKAVWISGFLTNATFAADPAQLPDTQFTVEYGTGLGGPGAAATCDDASSPDGWSSDPGSFAANDPALEANGVYTAVSRVRVHAVLPGTVTGNATDMSVAIGMRTVPTLATGTIIPNWATSKVVPGTKTQAELLQTAWFPGGNDYNPQTNAGSAGDRLRIATATGRLSKRVKDPGTGQFVTTTPQFTGGQTADFRLQPTLSAGIATDVTVPVIVEDCLPAGEIFQAASSTPAASIVAATSPSGGDLTCAAGETYVQWNLGPQPINATLPAITYSVRIANGATSGTKTNKALITAVGDGSSVAQRSAQAAIQIVQPAGIKIDKIALTPIVEVNRAGETTPDPLQWRVDLVNLETDPGPTDVDIIDVLPKQGANGTDFTGTLAFTSAAVVDGDEPGQAVEILYTKAGTVNRDAADSSNDPATGSTWCSRSGSTFTKVLGAGTSADCPAAAADVTGLRVRRPGILDPSDLISFSIDMLPTGNRAGDVYVNEAAARATGLDLIVGPVDAPETVVASSVGDYVWNDTNLNGIQDAGEAPLAGFTVHLEGTDTDGNTVGPLTTTTDANGRYSFTGLQSGGYKVTFAPGSLAAGQHFTLQDAGGNDLTDSDGDPATGEASILLAANYDDVSVDQGVFTADPDIEVTKYINGDDANTAPGVLVEPGDDMLVTFDVHNDGNMDLDPVVLTDDTIATADITCPKTALAIDETMTCTAAYPAPAAGTQHTNTATVTGTPIPLPDGTQLPDVTDDDPANAFGIVRDVDMEKTLVGSPVPKGDGTYAITYDIVVTNLGTQATTYDLRDELRYGAGIAVTDAEVVSGPAGVTPNAGWNGTTDQVIATGVALARDAVHTYRVRATATLDEAVVTTDSSDCQTTGTETGTGFLNTATLSTSDDEVIVDDACAPAPHTTMTKTSTGQPVANGDGTYTQSYEIEVTNDGAGDDVYDLADELHLGAGIDVASALVSNTAPGTITTTTGWNGSSNLEVVADQAIEAGATHTYRVTLIVTVDDAIVPDATDCDQAAGEGTGLLNGAVLTVNGEDTDDDACEPVPHTTISKDLVGDPVVEDDNSVTSTYLITVTNDGAGDDVYDLRDQLAFGADITVGTAEVANAQPGTITTDPEWDGQGNIDVVLDQAIDAGATHTYLVTVNATVGTSTTVAQADCTVDTGEQGTGFLNGATLTVNGETSEDDACGEVDPEVVVAKTLVGAPSANGDGTWTIDYDVVATNVGPAPGTYDLRDELAYGSNVSVLASQVTNTDPGGIATDPDWDGINVLTVVSGEPIAVGTSHTYRVTVQASVAPGVTSSASDCELAEGETGTGFLNTTRLTSGNGTSEAEACGEIPSISIVKAIEGSPTVSDAGVVGVTYSLTVTNDGRGDGTYDLDDELTWGAGLTVTDAEVVLTPAGEAASTTWNGTTDTVVATDVPLAAGGTHRWEVHVIGQRSDSLTTTAGDCTLGAGERGTGLLNTATVTVNGQSADSDACAPVKTRTKVTDRVVDGPLGPLPRTGAAILGLALTGLALVGAGLALRGTTRGRRRRATA